MRRLISEIHRRSLWQVLGIYLAASWVAYQVVLSLTDGIGLPDWVPGLAIALLVIGIPLVLATAIVQEGPPARGVFRALRSPSDARRLGDLPELELVDDIVSAPGAEEAPRDPVPDAVSVAEPSPQSSALPSAGTAVAGARSSEWLKRLLTWPRALLVGVVGFALLGIATTAYMTMRTFGIGPAGTLVAQGVLDPRAPILLADFESPTGDTVLAAIIREALRVDLAQSSAVSLVDPLQVREALQRMRLEPTVRLTADLARQVAIREGTKAYLRGEVSRVGGYLITAELVSTEEGRTLVAFRQNAPDSTRVLPAVDRLSSQVRERVGESLKTIRAREPLEAVTTASLEALRDFTLAQRAIERGDYATSVALLRDAIGLDTAFAMAHRQLSTIYWNIGEVGRAADAMRATLRHQDRLTERERYHAVGAFDLLTGRYSESVAAYERVLDTHPDDVSALNNLALAYLGIREPVRAESAAVRSLRSGLTFGGTYGNVVHARLQQGDTARAREMLAALRRQYPEHPQIPLVSAEIDAYRGDYGAAITTLQRSLETAASGDPSRAWNFRFRARLRMGQGRTAEGDRLWVEAAERYRRDGSSARAFETEVERAFQSLWTLDAPEEALAITDRLARRVPFDSLPPDDRPYLVVALLYAQSGRPDRARELVRQWETTMDPDLRHADEWLAEVVRGAALTSDGRAADAVAALRPAVELGPCPICGLPELAEAYAAAGDDSAAVDTYERFLSTPSFFRSGMSQFMAPSLWSAPFRAAVAHERLAGLYEARADYTDAARHYAHVLELWSASTPEIGRRLEAARRRLQRLEERRG